MICYASFTETERNLDALRRHGWRLLVSRARRWMTAGFRFCADSGAWSDYQAGRPFDEAEYDRFLDWLSEYPDKADWLVLPDIVAGGRASLDLSVRYLNRGLSVAPLVLVAVQDGMLTEDLASLVGPQVGIFLGGSTEWKLDRMVEWGRFCAERGIYYHIARVNTARRLKMAVIAGAASVDGTSATRYSINTPRLSEASRYRGLFDVRGLR